MERKDRNEMTRQEQEKDVRGGTITTRHCSTEDKRTSLRAAEM
jgi:hypothetical protein